MTRHQREGAGRRAFRGHHAERFLQDRRDDQDVQRGQRAGGVPVVQSSRERQPPGEPMRALDLSVGQFEVSGEDLAQPVDLRPCAVVHRHDQGLKPFPERTEPHDQAAHPAG